MSLYKKGKFWYMDFVIKGKRVNRSTGSTNEDEARKVEDSEKEAVRKRQNEPVTPKLTLMTLEQGFERALNH
jgi:hypothetical protein